MHRASRGCSAGWSSTSGPRAYPPSSATTGLAFHFNRPNATAPQALLLAVPPVLRGHWQWDALKGSVREALDLAKLRALDPEALAAGGYFQGLPAILSEFSKNRFAATHLTERSVKAARSHRAVGAGPCLRANRLDNVVALAIEPRRPLPLFRGWNRLEGRPRVTDFERSLRAEVRDPLWFLTRQWQFGEFRGEDAASPIDVAVGVRLGSAGHASRIGPEEAPTTPARPSRHASSASRRRSISTLHMQASRYLTRLLLKSRLIPGFLPSSWRSWPMTPASVSGEPHDDAAQLQTAGAAFLFDTAALLASIRDGTFDAV